MGEEVKTDVGSAAERDQAAEHRQQEIQKATVGEEVEGGHMQAIHTCSQTDHSRTGMVQV